MDRAYGTFSRFIIYDWFPGIKIPGYNMGRSYGTAKWGHIEEL